MDIQSEHESLRLAGIGRFQGTQAQAGFDRLSGRAPTLLPYSKGSEGHTDILPSPLAPKEPNVDRNLEEARVICGHQKSVLDRIQAALERMSDLARHAQDESHPMRPPCNQEFQELAAGVKQWAQEEVDGRKLFHGQLQAVPLEDPGNQLIMAGVNLETKTFRALSRLVLASPVDAVPALLRVRQALSATLVFQAILAENLGRLSFLGGRLDAIREGLRTTPPLAKETRGSSCS